MTMGHGDQEGIGDSDKQWQNPNTLPLPWESDLGTAPRNGTHYYAPAKPPSGSDTPRTDVADLNKPHTQELLQHTRASEHPAHSMS